MYTINCGAGREVNYVFTTDSNLIVEVFHLGNLPVNPNNVYNIPKCRRCLGNESRACDFDVAGSDPEPQKGGEKK